MRMEPYLFFEGRCEEAGEPNRNEPLALTLARAHRWRDLLEAGRYPTVRALAKDLGLEWSYVGRIIRLTLLAPDIVEAIINGEEPDGLSYRKLVRLPVGWEAQRRKLAAPEAQTLHRGAEDGVLVQCCPRRDTPFFPAIQLGVTAP